MTERESFIMFIAAICFATNPGSAPESAFIRAEQFVQESEKRYGPITEEFIDQN
jgi:hypothetical protein